MTKQLVNEVCEPYGDWYSPTGEELIKFIRAGQAKAREAIPDQDVKFVISAWSDRTNVYLKWNVPYTEEEILRHDHSELISEMRNLLVDRRTFVKYDQSFPDEKQLRRVIQEAQALEAQMNLQSISPGSHIVKYVLSEYGMSDLGE